MHMRNMSLTMSKKQQQEQKQEGVEYLINHRSSIGFKSRLQRLNTVIIYKIWVAESLLRYEEIAAKKKTLEQETCIYMSLFQGSSSSSW